MLQGECSAPGKIIIAGEHSVVYGHPVLVVAINKRMRAKFQAEKDTEQGIKIEINSEVKQIVWTDKSEADSNEAQLIKRIIMDAESKHFGAKLKGGSIEIHLESEIPVGAGLGSSAAFGAVISGAILLSLSHLQDKELDKKCINEYVWSYTNFFEKLEHGKPSGCDAAIIMKGGALAYSRGTPPEVSQITPLPMCKIDRTDMIVVYCGKPHDTKTIVERVSMFKTSQPEEFKELIMTLRDVASEVIELLQETNLDKFSLWDYVSMSQ